MSPIITQLIVIPQTVAKCASQWRKTLNIPYHLTLKIPKVILCIKDKTIFQHVLHPKVALGIPYANL